VKTTSESEGQRARDLSLCSSLLCYSVLDIRESRGKVMMASLISLLDSLDPFTAINLNSLFLNALAQGLVG
jgi:hypothetical protein